MSGHDTHILSKNSLMLMGSFPLFSILLFVFSVKQTVAGDCPVVVDLSGNGRIDITGHTSTQEKLYTVFTANRFVEFDINADGEPDQIDWIKAGKDAILVDISNWSEGEDFDGNHLFGLVGLDDEGQPISYENGFEKLALLDLDTDGELSGAELGNLRLWKDNGNARPDAGEILTFEEAGLASIRTGFSSVPGPYGAEVLASSAVSLSGEAVYVEDIWFMTPDDVNNAWRDDIAGVADRITAWF